MLVLYLFLFYWCSGMQQVFVSCLCVFRTIRRSRTYIICTREWQNFRGFHFFLSFWKEPLCQTALVNLQSLSIHYGLTNQIQVVLIITSLFFANFLLWLCGTVPLCPVSMVWFISAAWQFGSCNISSPTKTYASHEWFTVRLVVLGDLQSKPLGRVISKYLVIEIRARASVAVCFGLTAGHECFLDCGCRVHFFVSQSSD